MEMVAGSTWRLNASLTCWAVIAATAASSLASHYRVRPKRSRLLSRPAMEPSSARWMEAFVQPGLLGLLDFVGGKAILQRAGQLVVEVGLDFSHVLQV